MKIEEIPAVQAFDNKQSLKRVEQDQQRFLVLTSESKAKGLRTDGVGPCIVLCGKIATESKIILGMYHWSGSSETDKSEKILDAKSIFKQFCSAFRKHASDAGVDNSFSMEMTMIGGEPKTENSSGTEDEQEGLLSCINEKNIKKFNIDHEKSTTSFNKKDLADEFISVYLISSGVYFKRCNCSDDQSKAYSSSSNSGSPGKLKADIANLKEEVSSIKKSQEELLKNMSLLLEIQNKREREEKTSDAQSFFGPEKKTKPS